LLNFQIKKVSFEEFFRKKKIDLAALGKAEPALFAEFKSHFEQMGERSFDHTKKYWFNKLRLIYHLAPEVKEEKVHIANPLAEQTITETLEEGAPTPNVGFKPRFKAGMATKSAEPKKEAPLPETEKPAESTTTQSSAPKPGFTPRFKAGVTKPVEPKEETPGSEKAAETPAASTSAPKPGFTPRFKAGITKPAESAEPKEEPKTEQPASAAPKPGFTPRFKAGVTKPAGSAPEQKEEAKTEQESAPVPSKMGFTPRFKAGVTKPAGQSGDISNLSSEESATATPEVNEAAAAKDQDPPFAQEKAAMQGQADAMERTADQDTPDEKPTQNPFAGKPTYKPRFNAKNMKPKDGE
jgi:hypothetical protein